MCISWCYKHWKIKDNYFSVYEVSTLNKLQVYAYQTAFWEIKRSKQIGIAVVLTQKRLPLTLGGPGRPFVYVHYISWYCSDRNQNWEINHFYLFIFFFWNIYWFERERERERERRKDQLVASHTHPNCRWNPQPNYVPWPGMEPTTSWCAGQCSNQLSHPSLIFHCFCNQSICWDMLFQLKYMEKIQPGTNASLKKERTS